MVVPHLLASSGALWTSTVLHNVEADSGDGPSDTPALDVIVDDNGAVYGGR